MRFCDRRVFEEIVFGVGDETIELNLFFVGERKDGGGEHEFEGAAHGETLVGAMIDAAGGAELECGDAEASAETGFDGGEKFFGRGGIGGLRRHFCGEGDEREERRGAEQEFAAGEWRWQSGLSKELVVWLGGCLRGLWITCVTCRRASNRH